MRSSLLAKFTDLPPGGSSQPAAVAAAGAGYADTSRIHPAALGSTLFILFSIYTVQGGPKKTGTIFVRLITSRNLNRFSEFFHFQDHE